MFSKRNVSDNLRLAILLVLSAGIILNFAPGVLAQPAFGVWSGPLSFQQKTTKFNGGQFITKSKSRTGTLELYIGGDGLPTPNADGDYIKISGVDKPVAIGIKQLVFIDTDVKPGNVKFLGVGTGVFQDFGAPDPGNQDGIVYLDFSGSWKAAAGKNPATVSLVIKGGGGIDGYEIFIGNSKVDLTNHQP